MATPISRWSTEFWTASTSTCMTIPIPTPTTSMHAAAVQIELPTPSRESRSRPTVMTNVPTIGNTLYRPVAGDHPAAHDRGRQQPEHQGQQLEPRARRALALDDLEEHGHVDDRAEQREPDGEADRARGDEDPVAEQRERHDRLARSRLGQDEQREQHRRDHDEADDLRRAPVVGRAAEADRQDQRGEPAGEERRAEPVDPVPDALDRRVEDDADDHERDDPDRDIDVEDPAPRQVVDEESAEQRPDHRGDPEDRAEEPLVPAPLAGRDDVADHRDRRHDQPAGAEALEGAEGDQLGHVLREAAEHRPDEEDRRSRPGGRACARTGRPAFRRSALRPSR